MKLIDPMRAHDEAQLRAALLADPSLEPLARSIGLEREALIEAVLRGGPAVYVVAEDYDLEVSRAEVKELLVTAEHLAAARRSRDADGLEDATPSAGLKVAPMVGQRRGQIDAARGDWVDQVRASRARDPRGLRPARTDSREGLAGSPSKKKERS